MTYVNLLLNPETNTGYVGREANRVWESVYKENCFKGNLEEMCLEQRVFFRLISGLHTSISMHIIHNFYSQADVFNVNKGHTLYSPNYLEYRTRFSEHPERIQNLYFVFTFYVRAVQKLKDFLNNYEFDTGNYNEDKKTKDLVSDLVNSKSICQPTFDESIIFRNAEKNFLISQMRGHFYNISRVMDCVACEKCRLWAKLQTLGLSTALKVVLSENTDECIHTLQRNELIAFINGFRQLSTSLKYLKTFDLIERRRSLSPLLTYTFLFMIFFGILVGFY